MQTERTWSESFTWHIRQVPFQLAHMRDLAETTVAAVDTSAVKVAGGRDTSPVPYRVDPADDADLLYLRLIKFGRQVAETIGGASPRPLRARMYETEGEPLGLPSCTPSEAFSLAAEIIQWLEAGTHQIGHHGELTREGGYYDELITTIRKMRGRYPRAEPKFKAYRPRPCTTCGERTVLPIWGVDGLAGAKCDTCGQTWEKKPG